VTSPRPTRLRRSTAVVAGILVSLSFALTGCTTPAEEPVLEPIDAEVSVVAEVEAPAGSISGGGPIVLTGLGLDGVTAVRVGDALATDVTVVDDTRVTAVAPRTPNYQPAAADIVALAGDDVVSSVRPAQYLYTVQTPVDTQLQYALTHWNSYNAAFGDYNPHGGDCANFVSQTLLARGWAMNDAWNNRGGQGSRAWVYAPALEDWLASDPSLGLTRLDDTQRDQLKLGDIAFFDWNGNGNPNHVMIVSDITRGENGLQIKVAGHNEDRDFRDIDEAITIDHPGSVVWY
jgi:hypothetical protein